MTRRDIYRYATMAVGGLMGVVLAVPGVAYVVSPLRKKETEGSLETLTRLNQLDVGVPRSFAIIKERQDAWVKYPREPVGSVWLIRQPPGAQE
jgi:quinol---cytochrome c reductase iron-sulfur subunit, bacillus type